MPDTANSPRNPADVKRAPACSDPKSSHRAVLCHVYQARHYFTRGYRLRDGCIARYCICGKSELMSILESGALNG